MLFGLKKRNSNFWQGLKKPFFVLAPMADVTDAAFRRIITKYGKPDVLWTEFVSADGLAHKDAREKLKLDLMFTKDEHPIVAQIFGSNADNIEYAAKYCAKLGFDGIDINMGCPDKSIEKQGAGASMMKSKNKAKEVIESARKAGLPVSVKTRIGYNKNEIDTWIRFLLEQNLPVLTVHLRTRKEMSLVSAHWDLMPEIIKLRNEIAPQTLIIGNGDAKDIADAKIKVKESGCDGVMLGRAIFGNPWLFAKRNNEPTNIEKLKVLIEHTKLFEKLIGNAKIFAIMKKHFKAYINNYEGAKELRADLMDNAHNAKEVKTIIDKYIKEC